MIFVQENKHEYDLHDIVVDEELIELANEFTTYLESLI